MITPIKLTRIDLYLRKDDLQLRFIRRMRRPNRTVDTWYELDRDRFMSLFSKFAFLFGPHRFMILSSGTWVYTWEIDFRNGVCYNRE